MSDKLFFLLEELKENYTDKLFKDTLDYIQNDPCESQLYTDISRTKIAINGQLEKFYNELAINFVHDLNLNPEFYFLIWEPITDLFSSYTRNLFFNLSLTHSENSEATDFLNGLWELENNNPKIALYHFNRIDDVVACYFIALCYFEMENYENSIKQNLIFLDFLQNDIINQDESQILTEGFLLVQWNIYNDLGYSYNRIQEFSIAIKYYEKALNIFDLEKSYQIMQTLKVDENLDDFLIFINNYIFALEKNGNNDKIIEILNFTISKYPSMHVYLEKKKIIGRIEKHSFANEVISNLFKTRKPFNIDSFQETKILSREKILEDMIVEQIKYGFNVFGKKLEIYQDEKIFGRQYYIENVNGILDLLLVDKTNDILYVVELKRDKAGIEVVEQIENYINGLTSELDREVRGIISLHKPDKKLIELIKTKSNIELYTYQFEFKNIE